MNPLAAAESIEELLCANRLVNWLQIPAELNLESENIVSAVNRIGLIRNTRTGDLSNKIRPCPVERHLDRTQFAEAALDG